MKIIVHPLLPTGNFLNCRIGVEKDYPDDYSLEQAINTEWDNLIAIHMKRYPHLYDAVGKPLYEAVAQQDEFRGSKVVDVVEPQDKIQAFKETLDMCTNLTMLLRFKAQVDRIGDEGLTQFYETKLQSLKNQ